MWLRRLFRRRRPPPPPILPSVERLGELVDSVVALLDQAPVQTRPNPDPAEEPAAHPEPAADGHLLFVPGADGYELVQREGPAPARGDLLELAQGGFRVLRLGPSPLPGDPRRCACLEREELSAADRTFDR